MNRHRLDESALTGLVQLCSAVLKYAHSLIGAREEKRGKMREKEEASLTQQQSLTEREVDSQKSLAKSRLKDGEPACHSPRNCLLISKQTRVAGAENGLRAALDPQFGEDMAHVQLDRPWCHDQRPCNLLVGSPTCQQLQHLQFALAQWIK